MYGNDKWREEQTKKLLDLIHFSKTTLLEHILRKNSTFTFWCMVIPLDPHSVVTPNEKPKDFVKWFFSNNGPRKLDHNGRRPSSMVRLHGPQCKHAQSSNVGLGSNEVMQSSTLQHIGMNDKAYNFAHPIPSWPSSWSDHDGKRPSSMVRLHGPRCKQAHNSIVGVGSNEVMQSSTLQHIWVTKPASMPIPSLPFPSWPSS